MKFAVTSAAALMLGAAPVLAGGIERAPQSLSPLFEAGDGYLEFSVGRVSPDVSGQDAAAFGGSSFGNVGEDYSFAGMAYKRQLNPNLSAAIIVEQPFGADILYPSSSVALGGTAVSVNSTTATALLRYRFENNFGVHGGLRASRADANVTLSGLAYGPLNGYNLDTDSSTGIGWVAGISWEKPEIAARVSLTYNSPIEHDFQTTENIAPGLVGDITVDTPRSWTLEGQTGVAADTLVFGSIRWVNWSEFLVTPPALLAATGGGLVDLEDSTTLTLGVGRKFTENWSGSVAFTYEKAGDELVSPLAPTNGRKGVTLAAIYTQGSMKVSTGISYSKLGDAMPETGTPDTARASMEDSSVLGIGMKVGFTF